MKKTTAYARKRAHRLHVVRTYDHWTELAASPTELLPKDKIAYQLTAMWEGLAALEKAPEPTTNDWRVCSDAVNLMETLTTRGPWLDCDGSHGGRDRRKWPADGCNHRPRPWQASVTGPVGTSVWTPKASKPFAPFLKTTPPSCRRSPPGR